MLTHFQDSELAFHVGIQDKGEINSFLTSKKHKILTRDI